MKLPPVNPADDQWIREHFEELVDTHPGKYVAVADGRVSIATTRKEAETKLGLDEKKTFPSVMQIPHKESLTCAL